MEEHTRGGTYRCLAHIFCTVVNRRFGIVKRVDAYDRKNMIVFCIRFLIKHDFAPYAYFPNVWPSDFQGDHRSSQ